MHGPTARPLPLPYLQIINPLEGFVGAEDQASNKPADMFKSFRTTKDLSKTFHPLGQDLGHPNNRQHGSTLSFSISFFLSSSIHPFFPITFQVVYSTPSLLPDEPLSNNSITPWRFHSPGCHNRLTFQPPYGFCWFIKMTPSIPHKGG